MIPYLDGTRDRLNIGYEALGGGSGLDLKLRLQPEHIESSAVCQGVRPDRRRCDKSQTESLFATFSQGKHKIGCVERHHYVGSISRTILPGLCGAPASMACA